MNIGIFGGAFNPVHNGHINLADDYFSKLSLDKIIFIPTACPVHKTAENFASPQDRINMLKLALEGRDKYEISDIEFKRNDKSYTFFTLRELRRIYPDDNFYLIIGADQFLTFHLWYEFEEILKQVTLCTIAREDDEEKKKLIEYSKSLEKLNAEFYISDSPVIKISSSDIRQLIQNGGDISPFVPAKVCKYISEKGLYCV